MSAERTFDLDVDRSAGGDAASPVLRVILASARAYTRDGGAPTITADCPDVAAFAREIERLKGELDQVLARARGEVGREAAAGRPGEAQAAAAPRPALAELMERLRAGEPLSVADLMTREVKTVGRNDRLSLAEELMKQGRFRHLVVLDDDGRVAGVVSRRDVFDNALAWAMGLGQAAHEKALARYPVKEAMRAEPVTAAPDEPLAAAAARMIEHKIGCLPVVEEERLVGILTEGDFLALLAAA